jgi:CheY-like chemotaxis protein/HEAT repeat protein
MGDFLPDLKNHIKTGRISQAKTLLSDISSLTPEEKQAVIQMLALAPDKPALELLSFVTSEQYRDPDIYDRLIQLVIDRAHLNFHFVVILFNNADKKMISQAYPLLRHALSNETDKALLNTIIRTAGKLKLDKLTKDIAEFIFYDDTTLKSEAVKALERIGSPLACEKLERASRTEKCDDDILDALQVLKEARTVKEPEPKPDPVVEKRVENHDKKIKDLSAKEMARQFEALVYFTEKTDLVVSLLSEHKGSGDRDLLINLLMLVSRVIPVESIPDILKIINDSRKDNIVRFCAYNALAAFPEIESAAAITGGLSEPSTPVRLAAVKVLDKHLTDFVCAEIKNRIESGTKKGEQLAETILDANAKKMIQYLMISDTFSYMASNYLTRKTPLHVLDTFISILEERNLKSTARKYMDLREQKAAQEIDPFIVISTNKALLDIYSKLIYASGLSCKCFNHPQDAFEAFVFQRPGAIITDLFLTDMTGLEIATEAREIYPKEDVPVILSTMHKNLDSNLLEKELGSAGVNVLCDFPPKTSQIKSWIK